jgi:NAD kinase
MMDKDELDHCEKALVLNEVFTAEKDAGSASRYRVRSDETEMGVFKSSGLIISTGTGSTGWLYSSRQISPAKVDAIARIMGGGETNSVINE